MGSAAPAALRLLEGRGKGRDSGGRVVESPPPFVRLPPDPPAFLSGAALEVWERMVPELQRLRLLKPIDGPALTAYCLAWQRLVDAQALIDREGLLHVGTQGRCRHPAVQIVEVASRDLRAWCAEFGLTPAAESKVKAAEATDGDSPFGG